MKESLRRTISVALGKLSPSDIASQSKRVLAQLQTLPQYLSARSASVYLPMERGCEVDTLPIIADLIKRGATVAIPRITGARSTDMEMYALSSVDHVDALPRTRWGIPEPDDAAAATMERVTETAFDIVLVPGVAFDARCNRIGHGRGYYDAFLSRQRGVAIGLALSAQIVASVPTSEHDQRLAFVVHPAGRLAYTSSADEDAVAAIASGGTSASSRHVSSSSSGRPSPLPEVSPRKLDDPGGKHAEDDDDDDVVNVARGTHKYVCVRITQRDGSGSFLVVRSAGGDYHSQVAAPIIAKYRSLGMRAEPLGGGRIRFNDDGIFIYGYSVGFRGSEGGPPGEGMRDHQEVARLVAHAHPDVKVTFSADGY